MKLLRLSNSPIHNAPSIMRNSRLVVLSLALVTAACVCSAAPSTQPDEWFRSHLVGTWTCNVFGTQKLTNHSDGTATLDVTLNRLGALRYGKSLTLDLEWTVEGGVLKHTVVGGSPPEKVARLVRDWGTTLEYEIVEVTDSHMLLEKPDQDEKQTRWEAASDELAQR